MQEYPVICPELKPDLKYDLLKFNIPLKNDFVPNIPGQIYRQHHLDPKKNKVMDEDDEPKYGAGSSYKDFVNSEKKSKTGVTNKIDDKTWTLNVGSGKSLKSYKGQKEGNVTENCQYYVFIPSSDGKSFEAYPISSWYNFKPIPKYKTLNDEEAEQEFLRRDKVLNYFSIMVQKRLVSGEEADGKADVNAKAIEADNDDTPGISGVFNKGGGGGPKQTNANFKKGVKGRTADSEHFKLRDIDYDEEVGIMEGDDDDISDTEATQTGVRPKKVVKKKSDKKRGRKDRKADDNNEADDIPLEESDDGDEEGQELDYDSAGESSSSESISPRETTKNKAKDPSTGKDVSGDEIANRASTVSLEDLIDSEDELGVADEPGLRELHLESEEEELEGKPEMNQLSSLIADENGKRISGGNRIGSGNEDDDDDHSFDEEEPLMEGSYKHKTSKDAASKKHHKVNRLKRRMEGSNPENQPEDSSSTSSQDDDNNVNSKMPSSSSTKKVRFSNQKEIESSKKDLEVATNDSPTSSESSATSSDDSDMDDNNIKSSIFLQKKTDSAATLAKERQYASIIQESVDKSKQQTQESKNISSSSHMLLSDVSAVDQVASSSNSSPVIELNTESVRRYLQRRPMTAKELLHKFKKSSAGLESRTQLAERMTAILKELYPERKMIKGKMYFSINSVPAATN